MQTMMCIHCHFRLSSLMNRHLAMNIAAMRFMRIKSMSGSVIMSDVVVRSLVKVRSMVIGVTVTFIV